MQVSHETIYRSLFIQARGVLKKALTVHLRSRRKMRHSRKATTEGQKRGQIVDAISIESALAEVQDRAIPGHWEGDLIAGCNNSHIATLVERQSRFTMLVKVAGKTPRRSSLHWLERSGPCLRACDGRLHGSRHGDGAA